MNCLFMLIWVCREWLDTFMIVLNEFVYFSMLKILKLLWVKKDINVYLEIVLKSFYLFISDLVNNSVPEGKLNFLSKNQIISIKFCFPFHCW